MPAKKLAREVKKVQRKLLASTDIPEQHYLITPASSRVRFMMPSENGHSALSRVGVW